MEIILIRTGLWHHVLFWKWHLDYKNSFIGSLLMLIVIWLIFHCNWMNIDEENVENDNFLSLDWVYFVLVNNTKIM